MWSYNEILALSQMVGPIRWFCSDEEDEFQVKREDGSALGIFKTWTVPVIPFLDTGNVAILLKLWPQLQQSREEGFTKTLQRLAAIGNQEAITALTVLEKWKKVSVNNPVRLQRSLKRARLHSWLLDQRLVTIFAHDPLESDLPQRIRQLVSRLHLALGLLSPFFNLETVVGDPERTLGTQLSSQTTKVGLLDAVAFLLPSAFRDFVVAERLNWCGLSWHQLREQTEKLLHNPKEAVRGRILLNISRLAGVPPHHILFATNALEWIPRRVGGKKNDVPTHKAVAQLDEALLCPKRSNTDIDVVSVLADINALIRFLNWVPLIEGEENFQGRNWTYDSVYTGNSLLDTLSRHPEVWRNGFKEEFEEVIKPQLENLDAASAKGRALLQLILVEEGLKNDFFPSGLDVGWQREILRRVTLPATDKHEVEAPTKRIYPPTLVGGKPFGLALASYVLPQGQIPNAFVIPSDAIDSLFRENTKLWQKILQLDQEEDIVSKYGLAREVRRGIVNLVFPEWFQEILHWGLCQFPQTNLWAIRSSMQDEGEARGVYQTLLRIPTRNCLPAVRKCILSYYSRKALSFRMIIGAGDFPDFAILVHPYKRAKGGTGVISEGDYTISIGVSPAMVTANKEILDEVKGNSLDKGKAQVSSEVLGVIDILTRLEGAFGQIQIEWLSNLQEGVTLLQMESSSTFLNGESQEGKRSPTHVYPVSNLGQIEAIGKLLEGTTDALVKIELGESINLESFQGKLLYLIARIGNRIVEIQLPRHVSSSSHFANICRFFEIKLSSVS